MTALRESEVVVSASGIEIGSEFRNRSSVPAFAQPLGGNGGDADTVPLDQDAGNAAASALLNGDQHSDVDIVSAQVVFRF